MLGIAHQLHGMPGAFHYSGSEQVEMKEMGSKKLDLEIGSVEPRKLDRVTEIMKTVPGETSEASLWKLSGLVSCGSGNPEEGGVS